MSICRRGSCRGGLVERPLSLNWSEYQALLRVQVFADFHCVTRWSRLGNVWEGDSVHEIARRVGILPTAKFVVATGYDWGRTTNLPLSDFLAPVTLIADTHDGEPLDPDHGAPARLMIPLLSAWKSTKWLRRIDFRPGRRSRLLGTCGLPQSRQPLDRRAV